jgi:uncharacterized protein with HEPN domain
MPRDFRLYLDDILESIEKIFLYVKGLDFEQFSANSLAADAVARNLEIIGEAARKIPVQLKSKSGISEEEWRKILGLRNILAHEYFGVNLKVVWDIIQNKLPPLKEACGKMMKISDPLL